MFLRILLLCCLLIAAQGGPKFPQTWSSDVEFKGLLGYETEAFVGQVIADGTNNRMATTGTSQSEFQCPVNSTSVSLCQSGTWWTITDGQCSVGCCNGESDVTRSLRAFHKKFTNFGETGCACDLADPFIFLVAAKEQGSCTRDLKNGTLYELNFPMDPSPQMLFCMDDDNSPIFFHESAIDDVTGIQIAIDITFSGFVDSIVNPSIFDVPANCDCLLD